MESLKVDLDIGGQIFATQRKTIAKSQVLKERMGDQSSVLFIDRDPKYFPFILSYLRTGNVLIDFDLIKETDLYGIIQEAEYYKLDGMINEIKSNQNNPVPPAETKWSNGDIKKDYSSNSSKTDGEAHFINQSCRNSPRPAHKKKSHPSYQQIT